jgi:hypothetical protein
VFLGFDNFLKRVDCDSRSEADICDASYAMLIQREQWVGICSIVVVPLCNLG